MKVSKKFMDWLEYWEGDKVLRKDITPLEKEVRKHIPEEWRKERRHFETMVSLAHSMGPEIFSPRTPRSPIASLALVLNKHLTPANERSAATAILLSSRTDRSVRRRNAERELFLNGNYHTET